MQESPIIPPVDGQPFRTVSVIDHIDYFTVITVHDVLQSLELWTGPTQNGQYRHI